MLIPKKRNGSRKNEDGSVSTHVMSYGEADGRFYAFPTLFQNKEGEWIEPEDPFKYARENGELQLFDSEEQASEYSEGSWKQDYDKKYDTKYSGMDKKQFLELKALLEADPKALDNLSIDERKGFQNYLIEKGFEMPKYGADGGIGTETLGALKKYSESPKYTEDTAVAEPEVATEVSTEESPIYADDVSEEEKKIQSDDLATKKLRAETKDNLFGKKPLTLQEADRAKVRKALDMKRALDESEVSTRKNPVFNSAEDERLYQDDVSTFENPVFRKGEEKEIPRDETSWERKTAQRLAEEKKYLEESAAQRRFETDKALTRRGVYDIGQTANLAVRTAESLNMIKAAKEQRENAVRPSFNPREVSPESQGAYQRALAMTGRGYTDAERAAATGLNLSSYVNTLKGTAALGQGQASIAGVGAQSLHANNLRNNLNASAANAQIRQSNDAYASDAGAKLAADKNALYNSGLQYNYVPALADYRRKMGEAGITGRQGYENLDRQRSTLPYLMANSAGNAFGSRVQSGDETAFEREQRMDDSKLRRREYFNNLSNSLRRPSNEYDAVSYNEPVNQPQLEPYNPSLMQNQGYNPQYYV